MDFKKKMELYEFLHKSDMVIVLVLSDLPHLVTHEITIWLVLKSIQEVKNWLRRKKE